MAVANSTIDGLWVVMVSEGGEKVPMLARAGEDLFLLAFKTGFSARKFATDSQLNDFEPRMLVAGNSASVIASLREKGAQGILVDYDASTRTYKHADVFA